MGLGVWGGLGLVGLAAAPAPPSAAGVRIALVSDVHMGDEQKKPDARRYRERFVQAIAAVNAARVDLVLMPGDLTEDGSAAQLQAFAALARGFQAPVCWVPGNHDIGAKAIAGKQAGPKAERLATYEQVLGPAFFVRTVAGIRVIGLASPLLGGGLPAEARQWALLEKELAAPVRTPTVLLTHYPPYNQAQDEPSDAYWNIEPAPRARLLALLERGGVSTILCGHLHRSQEFRGDGRVILVTGPVSFGLPKGKTPQGWTLVTLAADGTVTAAFQAIAD